MITFRRFVEADCEAVLELDKATTHVHYNGILDYYEDTDGEPSLDAVLLDWQKVTEGSREVFVAESDGSLIGFIVAEPHRDTKRLWILDIAVAQDYRRNSVGTNLIAHVVASYPAYQWLATVNARNAGAIKFMKSLGFAPVLEDLLLTKQ